ncbi:MAG: hypothetical protein AAFN81_01290 [Bacteroidota bacterium]
MKTLRLFVHIGLILFSTQVLGQHQTVSEHGETEDRHFHISVAIGHTYLPESSINGKTTLTLPSIGFDLEYYLNSKLGIGLHNDIELVAFEIEEEEGTVINREYPLLLTADFLYKPLHNMVLFVGPGVELEKEENFAVLRMGIEYMAYVNDCISFSPILFYDFRIDAYDSLSIGIGMGYKFGGHQN